MGDPGTWTRNGNNKCEEVGGPERPKSSGCAGEGLGPSWVDLGRICKDLMPELSLEGKVGRSRTPDSIFLTEGAQCKSRGTKRAGGNGETRV